MQIIRLSPNRKICQNDSTYAYWHMCDMSKFFRLFIQELFFFFFFFFFWHEIQSAISLSSDLSKSGSISISYYSHLWLVIINLTAWLTNVDTTTVKNKISKFLINIFEINTTTFNIFRDHAQHYRPLENKNSRL